MQKNKVIEFVCHLLQLSTNLVSSVMQEESIRLYAFVCTE